MQFTDTDKRAGIYNGNAGTITAIDQHNGTLRAVLDAAGHSKGREVVWSAAEFSGFRHGYAGTIYKGQGKTLDHTYLYHTRHWRSASSYVALTRQRDSAQVFVARDTARDARDLAWQMARGEIKSASIAWATREEVTPAQRRETQAGRGHRRWKTVSEPRSAKHCSAGSSGRRRSGAMSALRLCLRRQTRRRPRFAPRRKCASSGPRRSGAASSLRLRRRRKTR